MGWLSVYPLPRAAPLRLFGAAAEPHYQQVNGHRDWQQDHNDGSDGGKRGYQWVGAGVHWRDADAGGGTGGLPDARRQQEHGPEQPAWQNHCNHDLFPSFPAGAHPQPCHAEEPADSGQQNAEGEQDGCRDHPEG